MLLILTAALPAFVSPTGVAAQGEYLCVAVDQPLVLLSTTPGYTSTTMTATVTDCAGNPVAVPSGTLKWDASTDAVTIDPNTGFVTVNYVPDSSNGSNYWRDAPQIRARLDGYLYHLTNWAFVVITAQDLTAQMDDYEFWTDTNVSFYFPPHAFGYDFAADYAEHDIVHLTDLAYQIMVQEVFGHRPHFGGPALFALTPGIDQGAPCGINGAPALLGIRADQPQNMCASAQHVGVIWHEMAHNVTLDTEANPQYYKLWVSDDDIFIYVEGMATWGSIYANHRLLGVSNYLGMGEAARTNLETASNSVSFVRQVYLPQLDAYEAAGSPFETITPDHIDAILLRLTDEYGWEFFARAMSVLRTGTPFANDVQEANNRGLTARHTLTIAALSAGARVDLRPQFRSWNFPIDDAYFNTLYAKFAPYAAAFTIPLVLPEPLDLHVFDPVISPHYTVDINGVVLPRGTSTVIAIEWDWGDGTVETSWFPASHQYTEPNTYTVTVTAIDDQNNRVSQSVIAEVFAPKGCYPLNATTVICGY